MSTLGRCAPAERLHAVEAHLPMGSVLQDRMAAVGRGFSAPGWQPQLVRPPGSVVCADRPPGRPRCLLSPPVGIEGKPGLQYPQRALHFRDMA
ncbi:hypothetical protein NDU88_001167 [Pleurodeles waltl]|uniref:Uncharacterized protein n=1 Tax=Pleurodeles waltl TaxID=8319 RepID=A0AAV7TH19_PLEWA|nr:hypothetical protein NDU88_001167 [Pleurodeles waltl]